MANLGGACECGHLFWCIFGAAINATIERIRAEAVETYKAGQQGSTTASTLPAAEAPGQTFRERVVQDLITNRVPAPVKGVISTDTPAAPTMSSREIAELTGKEHKHVLRDIRTMFAGLEMPIGATAQFWTVAQVPGANNAMRSIEVCNLPKDLTITLVSGYSVTMRHRIVTRWMELEAAQAPASARTAAMSSARRKWRPASCPRTSRIH